MYKCNEAEERADRHARRWIFALLVGLANLSWAGAAFIFWALSRAPADAQPPPSLRLARWYDNPLFLSEVVAYFLLGIGTIAIIGALIVARLRK